ncbi:MAG: dockerin type I repeat-containing protein, partial [Muribaculaceae bacterium]|nr:dockerin type I repeat-containing protein [Muribaculaceae bacterium]
DGKPVYQWIGPDIVEGDSPTGIIFNNGSTQTANLDYVAGGVYNLAGKLLYTVPEGSGEEPLIGDVNGDGHVNSVDITVLYNWLLDGDNSDMVNGDVDGDGHINSGDITIIYNIMLGN